MSNLDIYSPPAIIAELARGLTELERMTEAPKASGLPYPHSLHTGWNRLGRLMLRQGLPIPASLPALLDLCEQRLPWPGLSLPDGAWQVGDSLLRDRRTTEACAEMAAQAGDLERQESLMSEVLAFCHGQGPELQRAYEQFRTLLIKQPVMTFDKILDVTSDSVLRPLESLFKQAYEEIPHSCIHDGKVFTCRDCGWTVTWHGSTPHCGSPRCLGHNRVDHIRDVQTHPKLLRRVLPGLYRYVTIPGLAEMKFCEKAKKHVPQVELYPQYDRWDFRLHFADQQSWALDFKDWGRPYWLASELREKQRESRDARAIIVIPHRRIKENPGYLNVLRNLVTDANGLEFYSDRELLKEIKAKVGG